MEDDDDDSTLFNRASTPPPNSSESVSDSILDAITPGAFNSDDEDLSQPLSPRALRRTHFITLARADLSIFPDSATFAAKMNECFEAKGRRVEQWACCQEDHRDGVPHYHLLVKIGGKNCQRFEPVKEEIKKRCGVIVHFTKQSTGGYSAGYRYITKFGMARVSHSPNHPHLEAIAQSRTAKCRASFTQKNKERKRSAAADAGPEPKKAKAVRLRLGDVGKLISDLGIETYTRLEAIAQERRENGDNDLFDFIARTRKSHTIELIERMNSLKTAKERLTEDSLSIPEKLERASKEPCVASCGEQKKWLQFAKHIISLNSPLNRISSAELLTVELFAKLLRRCLYEGRGKENNIFLTGVRDCGKSFLLQPLSLILNCFQNPSKGNYPWIDLEGKDCLVMNDFRYYPELIKWNDLLLLCEGDTVQFPRPMSTFSSNLTIEASNKLPILATGREPIRHRDLDGVEHPDETEMMNVRWVYIHINKPLRNIDRTCKPCPRCFVELLRTGLE